MVKLCCFNSSWPQSAHSSQLGAPLSEAASIYKRAKECNLVELPTHDNFRTQSSNKCTQYFAEKLEQEYDFIGLIEEAIHVAFDHPANYDDIMNTKYDLTIHGVKNTDYGIIQRLNELSNIKKIQYLDENGNPMNDNVEYFAVYDNVPNIGALGFAKMSEKNKTKYNAENMSYGEGIAMIIKKKKGNYNIATWTKSDTPTYKRIIKDTNDENTKKANNADAVINYYSDDLGIKACKNDSGTIIYGKDDKMKTIDGGRPIIVSLQFNDAGDLSIYCAFHGVNFMNDYFDDNGTIKQISELDVKEQSNHFKNVVNAVKDFIQESIDTSSITDNSIYGKCELFVSCDSNDVNSVFYDNFVKGITLNSKKFKNKEIKINFDINRTELDKTCCSNSNSVSNDLYKDGKPKLKDGSNANANTVFVLKNVNDDLLNNHSYTDDFHKPNNYIFDGDFCFYGTSDESPVKMKLKIDDDIKLFRNEVIKAERSTEEINKGPMTQDIKPDFGPSDHEPVCLIIDAPETQGGKRRTRRRRRSTRRKRRMSRRRRRSTRRKR